MSVPEGAVAAEAPDRAEVARAAAPAGMLRFSCVGCHQPMRVSLSHLIGRDSMLVRCANAACRIVMEVRRKPDGVAPTGVDVVESMRELLAQKSAGAMTREEFDARKTALLARL